VYGSGKSSVAAQVAFHLERRAEPYALLDLDYLGWGSCPGGDRRTEFDMMLRNLAAVGSNYREAGVGLYVVAYNVRGLPQLRRVAEALGVPLRVVRLSVPLAEIERRLAGDVTTGRGDDLRDAASSIAAAEGVGIEDRVVANDRPVEVVAREVMAWLGWL
jgi:hypothetical protein